MGKDKKDVPYDAPWTENLRHRPDPNRVGSLQTVTPGRFEAQPAASAALPAATAHERPAVASHAVRAHDPQSTPTTEPSYYDVPMLKQPVWKWQIATYFFLGGLSAGAYVLARVADRMGEGEAHADVARVGAYVAMAALIPSPPLLIDDLGDPKRFHHMLRVWKPGTPMNLGTWSLVAYSGMVAFEVARQFVNRGRGKGTAAERGLPTRVVNNALVQAVHDGAGIPFALMVAGYTGVLLSCTSNPLWCKNPWLGPLFSASAIGTGAEAITLALDLGSGGGRGGRSQRLLMNVDSAAHAAELGCMRGFMTFAGEKAEVLRRGGMKRHHEFTKGAILAAEAVKRLPVRGTGLEKPVRMVASALGLAAGFAMRWSMVFGGHGAAADPHTARLVSRGRDSGKKVGGRTKAGPGRVKRAGVAGVR